MSTASTPLKTRRAGAAERHLRDHPRSALVATLGAPLTWLLVIYIGSLVVLISTAFFELEGTKVGSTFTLDNLDTAFTTPEYRGVVRRSVEIATLTTLFALALALPMAFYIARLAKPWARRALIVACLLPLWAGYLVKIYAWRAVLQPASEFGVSKNGGFLESVFGWTPTSSYVSVVITMTYMWFPYMVLPIYAALQRLPDSYLDASGDLGARPLRTFRSVIVPTIIPSIAAGAIFTFSLSLGDYVVPQIISDRKLLMVGNLIERTQLAPNYPLAAAFTLWPIIIIFAFLFAMSRLGAFEDLT